MNTYFKILLIAMFTFLINIPFGIWRGKTKRFSIQWFLSIHLPIPFIILMRIKSGIGFIPYSYPFFIFAFFSGQFIGSRIFK